MYSIEKLDKIYNLIIEDKDISNNEKIKIIQGILSGIREYCCFVDNKESCPYSIVYSYNEEFNETEIECTYQNLYSVVNGCEELERMTYCPYQKFEKDFTSLLTLYLK